MTHKKMLNYCWGMWPWIQSPSQKVATFTQLELLPSEITFQIKYWLPPSSATSLALCSRTLYNVIGEESLQSINANKSEKARFLQALDLDLPGTLYCFVCNRLHVLFQKCRTRIRNEERFQRVACGRCLQGDGTYNYGTALTYFAEFKFEHVQMAAKLRRRGQLSEAKAYMEVLSFIEPVVGKLTSLPTYKGLHLFEPCFINDKIYVRAQSWLWIPKGHLLEMPMRHRSIVCAHLDANLRAENAYTAAFRCELDRMSEGRQDRENRCALIRCRFCPTEVTIEVKRSATHPQGSFLVTTKWQALGSGFSPTESYWEDHLKAAGAPWPWAPEDPPGSVRDMYEAQAKAKHGSLLSVIEARKLIE